MPILLSNTWIPNLSTTTGTYKTSKFMFTSTTRMPTIPAEQQKTAGNSFFRKAGEETFFGSVKKPCFFSSPIQAKLTVSTPDDPQEKEADQVADKVMTMADPMQESPKEKNEKKFDRKEEEVQLKPELAPITPIQCKADHAGKLHVKPYVALVRKQADHMAANTVYANEGSYGHTINKKNISLFPSDVMREIGRGPPSGSLPFEQTLASSKGGGSILPDDTRQFMESRFNADFSGVRIHNDANAAMLTRNVNAQAFAHGNDIYFNTGKYSPDSTGGRTLLAHELTHTIQQGASKSSPVANKTISGKAANALSCKPVATSSSITQGQPVLKAGPHKKLQTKGNDEHKAGNDCSDVSVLNGLGAGKHPIESPISLFPADLQGKGRRGPPKPSPPFGQILASSNANGDALPKDKQFTEGRFSTDFSAVRIHTHAGDEGVQRSVPAGAIFRRSAIDLNIAARRQENADLQLKLDGYSKPGHGANSANRLRSEVDQQSARPQQPREERGNQTREEIQSLKNSKKRQLRPVGAPEINESRMQVPKAAEAKNKTLQKVDASRKPEKKTQAGKMTLKPKGSSKSADPKANSQKSLAKARSVIPAVKPSPVQPVQPFVPKDAAGVDLPVEPRQFSRFAEIAAEIQDVRDKGQELVEQGIFHEQQSHLIEGQIHASNSVVEESDSNLNLIDQGIEARQQAHQQGVAALQTSENKQRTVQSALPQHLESLNTSKRDSGEAVSESQSLHSESASNQPEDPEDRANAAEMGGNIGTVARDSSSIDQNFLQNSQHTQILAERTAQAANKNAVASAALQQISQKITQTTAKSSQLKAANQQARAQINARSNEPLEVREKANEMKEQGTLMINNSSLLERRLLDARRRFQQNLAKVPPVYEPRPSADGGREAGVIQRQAEPGDYGNRINVFENTFLDPRTHQSQEERQRAQQEALIANAAELDYIRDRLPGEYTRHSFWKRVRVGIGAKLNRFWNWISNLGVAGVLGGAGRLLVGMFNPMTYVHGVVAGFTQVVNGVVNLASDIFNLRGWAIIKSLADIATGVAVIAGTITGLALAVEVAMAALLIISAIFTLGASAGFILPVMLFAGKVMVVAGKIAFWAGAAAASLNLIAGIKSLVDMGNAESAEKLQAETNDFTQDMGGVATGLLNMAVGRAGMQGPARMASAANYAIRISDIAATSGSAAAARAIGSTVVAGLAAIPRGIGAGIRAAGRGISGGIGAAGGALRRGFSRLWNELASPGIMGRLRSIITDAAKLEQLIATFGNNPARLATIIGRFGNSLARLESALSAFGGDAGRLEAAMSSFGDDAARLETALRSFAGNGTRLETALRHFQNNATRLENVLRRFGNDASRLETALTKCANDASLLEALLNHPKIPNAEQLERILNLSDNGHRAFRLLNLADDAAQLESFLTKAGGSINAAELENLLNLAGPGKAARLTDLLGIANGNAARFAELAEWTQILSRRTPGPAFAAPPEVAGFGFSSANMPHMLDHTWEHVHIPSRLSKNTTFWQRGKSPASISSDLGEALRNMNPGHVPGTPANPLPGQPAAARQIPIASGTVQVGSMPGSGGAGPWIGQFFPVGGQPQFITIPKLTMQAIWEILKP